MRTGFLSKEVRDAVAGIGSAFAGFQLFSWLSGVAAFGVFGSWLNHDWIPFSRKVWIWIAEHLPLNFALTSEESDALTGAMLFAPAGIAAILWPSPKNADRRDLFARLSRNQLLGVALCVLAALIAAPRVLSDAIVALAHAHTGLTLLYLAGFLFAIAVACWCLASAIGYVLSSKENRSKFLIGALKLLKRAAIFLAIATIAAVLSWGLLISIGSGVRLLALALLSFALVVVSLRTPGRILQIAVVLSLLIVLGGAVDLLAMVFADIDDTPLPRS